MHCRLYFTLIVTSLTISNTLLPAEVKESAAHTDRTKENRNLQLLIAVEAGELETVKSLLDNGADANVMHVAAKFTALMYAARDGFDSIAQLLLNKGAKINARDINQDTALTLAARHGHATTVKLLLDNGANPKLQNKSHRTALEEAQLAANGEYGNLVVDSLSAENYEIIFTLLAPYERTTKKDANKKIRKEATRETEKWLSRRSKQ